MKLVGALVLVAGCSQAHTPGQPDAPVRDAPPRDALTDADPDGDPGLDATLGYAHSILIDGTDDFLASEQLATTSGAYGARLAWDADNLYIGYTGPDLDPAALDTGFKWLFVYIDTDPGAGTGATTSQTYNTQAVTFPTGFGAEHYARWKCDTSLASIESFSGGTWGTTGTPSTAQAGNFVELAIPRAALGGATTLGVVTWMINEKADFEGTFAGLYPDNFVDGYHQTLALSAYLRADLSSQRVPNDPANRAP